jgi:hypothetical protein
VISVAVSGNTEGDVISQTSPSVTLTPITLNGKNQTATGSLNEEDVTIEDGQQYGFDVTSAFENADFTCAQNPGDPATDCGGNTADNEIQLAYFGWTPSLNQANSTSNLAAGGISAGSAVNPAPFGAVGNIPVSGGFSGDVNPSPGNPDTTSATQELCAANPGNSGGTTACDATVSLGVPAYISAGEYTDILDVTFSVG